MSEGLYFYICNINSCWFVNDFSWSFTSTPICFLLQSQLQKINYTTVTTSTLCYISCNLSNLSFRQRGFTVKKENQQASKVLLSTQGSNIAHKVTISRLYSKIQSCSKRCVTAKTLDLALLWKKTERTVFESSNIYKTRGLSIDNNLNT